MKTINELREEQKLGVKVVRTDLEEAVVKALVHSNMESGSLLIRKTSKFSYIKVLAKCGGFYDITLVLDLLLGTIQLCYRDLDRNSFSLIFQKEGMKDESVLSVMRYVHEAIPFLETTDFFELEILINEYKESLKEEPEPILEHYCEVCLEDMPKDKLSYNEDDELSCDNCINLDFRN